MSSARKATVFLIRNVWLIFGLAYLALAAFPASYWYDVGATDIPDAPHGEPVKILFTGGPLREFRGSYTVTMRRFETGEIACEARGGPFPYKPGSKRPNPLTMEWWAPSDNRCHRPPVGTYIVTTCWEVEGPMGGLVPDKHVCSQPEAFNVVKKDEEG